MCDNFIASVVICLLSIQISPKLTAVVFSLTALCSDTIQYAPDPSLFLMAVPCVLSSEGPSLSPTPRFCCSNVLSAPHITSEPPKLLADTFFFQEQKSQTRLRQSLYKKAITKMPEFREKKT